MSQNCRKTVAGSRDTFHIVLALMPLSSRSHYLRPRKLGVRAGFVKFICWI